MRTQALALGFYAVGITPAVPADPRYIRSYRERVRGADYLGLPYLQNYPELRENPGALFPGARSLVVVAQNYFPPQMQPPGAPQVAYYAYGRDYHKIVRRKLAKLLGSLQEQFPLWGIQGRPYCDSAPLYEQYWAQQAGLGFRGRNGLLIIPGKGSYHFLGVLALNAPLLYDAPHSRGGCGRCSRCSDACPTGALHGAEGDCFSPDRCLSYLTIEHKEAISPDLVPLMGNHFYGCDVCQQVCPHNRFARPHSEPALAPRSEVLHLTYSALQHLAAQDSLPQSTCTTPSPPEPGAQNPAVTAVEQEVDPRAYYDQLTLGSAMRRATPQQLCRNARICLLNAGIPLDGGEPGAGSVSDTEGQDLSIGAANLSAKEG